MKNIKNKNCFLTGATGGLGECLAMELAKGVIFLSLVLEKKLKDLETKIIDKYDVKVFYEISDFKNTESIQQIADYY